MIDRLFFIFGEALISLRRNLGMAFAAISTVAVSIFLIGAFSYGYWALSNVSKNLTGKFEMRVMLKDGLSKQQISDAAQEIRRFDGVKTVNWIPKEKAWAKFSKENPELTKGLTNSFPDAFKIVLSDLSRGDLVADAIQRLPIVELNGVKYLRDEQRIIDDASRALRIIGLSIGGLLLLTAAVLIFNAIRLTIVARRIEVRIMQLVGASYLTTYVPFLIEGMLQGALGGLIAGGLLKVSYAALVDFLENYSSIATPAAFPTQTVVVSCVIVGLAYGTLCSLFALFRLQLRYR